MSETLLEAIEAPVILKLASGERVRLTPGRPVAFRQDVATRILLKAIGKVRAVSEIEPIPPKAPSAPAAIPMEPATLNARAIYWESGTGRILGPAVPQFLLKDGATFWIVTTSQGDIWWINADRLRSRKAFLTQREVREVELIRSF